MVHSLVASSDEWDGQMEGFQSSWPVFFEILRIYLTHFAGKKGATYQVMTRGLPDDALPAWTRLTEHLGVSGADVGKRRANASQPESVSGIVEHVHQDDRMRFTIRAPGCAGARHAHRRHAPRRIRHSCQHDHVLLWERRGGDCEDQRRSMASLASEEILFRRPELLAHNRAGATDTPPQDSALRVYERRCVCSDFSEATRGAGDEREHLGPYVKDRQGRDA